MGPLQEKSFATLKAADLAASMVLAGMTDMTGRRKTGAAKSNYP